MTNNENFWKMKFEPTIRIGRLLCSLLYQERNEELIQLIKLKRKTRKLPHKGLDLLGGGAEGAEIEDLFGQIVQMDPEFFNILAGTYRFGKGNGKSRGPALKNEHWLGPIVWEESSIDNVGKVRGKEVLLYLMVGDQFARI